jgi:hypothetical protein
LRLHVLTLEVSMSSVGRWNLVIHTPIGKQNFVLDLQSEATGSISDGKVAPTALETLDVTADGLSFSATVPSPFGKLNLAFTGAVEGNQMTGKCKTRFGTSDFTAARAE